MKTVITILVIFYAYLHVAENIEIKPTNILKDVVKGIGDGISDAAHEVIPDCVFGVKSVSVVLYTRDIPYGKNIGVNDVCNDFDRTQPIVFLVHGFISNANYTNSYKLSEALIKNGVTVFSLDWSDAACSNGLPVVKFLGYPSAVHNTREIGELMASYVISLITRCNIPLDNMTFVGHSLGAHVCGFAAKNINASGFGTVPLLIGADPAQPLFMWNKCGQRLCKTDAMSVRVLHTSSLGITHPIGHMDLYFNGGCMQPGCFIDIACSHSCGILYLAYVIEYVCGFPGVPMSYPAVISPISKPSYPQSNATDCFVMDRTIFDKNEEFNTRKEKTYYMFVKSKTLCTGEL